MCFFSFSNEGISSRASVLLLRLMRGQAFVVGEAHGLGGSVQFVGCLPVEVTLIVSMERLCEVRGVLNRRVLQLLEEIIKLWLRSLHAIHGLRPRNAPFLGPLHKPAASSVFGD